ncbi:hypothetical protein [Dethiothermospora halolimnae]|uniref:hypothetical protein n=1 Tax=Dethiothermospora halolimnae TaxID=3114390 RepID=UPI003CCBC45D
MTKDILTTGIFTLAGAVLGYVGSLFSGYVSGKYSYKGAMDAVTKQLKFEKSQIIEEKKEQEDIAVSIIKTFLMNEIKKNYSILKKSDPSGEYLKILKREKLSNSKQLANTSFAFIDYNKIKYNIIKYNVKTIKDTIEVYRTFEYLQSNAIKRYSDLPEDDKEFLKKGIIKCEKMIESPCGSFFHTQNKQSI